jgi:hypothetical protein
VVARGGAGSGTGVGRPDPAGGTWAFTGWSGVVRGGGKANGWVRRGGAGSGTEGIETGRGAGRGRVVAGLLIADAGGASQVGDAGSCATASGVDPAAGVSTRITVPQLQR